MASEVGGYDNNFVDTSPDDLTCLICHSVARDPQQISCCAKLYCQTCLDHQTRESNTCPTCRQPISSFSDKLSHRRIMALKVSCDNKGNGCTWVGELGSLEAHRTGCEFSEVSCPNNCSTQLLRRDVKSHIESVCPQRDYTCRLCDKQGTYCDITTTHVEQCPNVIVPCPNTGCGTDMKRCEISKHRQSCLKEVVKCSYAKVGCEEEMAREECEEHEADNVELHLQLAVDRISTLESKVREPIVPVVFKLSDFSKLKDENDEWYSGEFYSHPAGYRMTLNVEINGEIQEKCTYLSVFVCLTGGEHDDNLVWPFNGTITIELLNQLEDRNHTQRTVELTLNKSRNAANRPPQGGRNDGYGWCQFISHTALAYSSSNNCQYLKDDCLYFRVTKVKLNRKNTTKPWLALGEQL